MTHSAIRSSLLALPALALALATSACGHDPCDGASCEQRITVAHTVNFAVANDDGTSEGFDLDGRISPDNDGKTCGHGDYLGMNGEEGIDNQSSVLFDAVRQVTEASLEELIRIAINEGNLLLMFEMSGIDDMQNDDCVDLDIFQGKGDALVGTDDFILPNQTFELDLDKPSAHIDCARIEDGVLTAGPFDGSIYLSILRVEAELHLHGARIRAQIGKDGIKSLVLGAGIETAELHSIIDQSMDHKIIETGHFLVDRLADMAADGNVCTQISSTLLVDAKPAFLF
jgi:hypothetical protein